MISINGTTIEMTRGETLKTYLTLHDAEGDLYTPDPNDRIRFAAKKTYNDAEPLIIKEIPVDSLLLVLNPEDTKPLSAPASYVYDIEITYANGDVDTFINKAKLKLTEEVY